MAFLLVDNKPRVPNRDVAFLGIEQGAMIIPTAQRGWNLESNPGLGGPYPVPDLR
jgi:hypothetical protein